MSDPGQLSQSSQSYMVLDYVLSALKGMRSDKYVPHCIACVNNSKYFQIDVLRFETTFANTDISTSLG